MPGHGPPVRLGDRIRVAVYLTATDAEAIDDIATARDISRSAAARELLRQALAARPTVEAA